MTSEIKEDKTSLEKTREKELTKKTATMQSLSDLLKANEQKMKDGAPKFLNTEALIRVALSAVQKNPLLMKCSAGSILQCCMDTAAYGLIPNSATNECHLVPFGGKDGYNAVLIVGYRGLTKLATNTGLVTGVTVRRVHKNDPFSCEYGLNEHLEHRPAQGDRGEFIGAYSIVRFKDGSKSFEYMTLEEGRAHRDRFSRTKSKSTPWYTDEESMIMKTTLRKALKYVPSSPESETLSIAIAKDELLETRGIIDIDKVEPLKEEIPEPQPLKKEEENPEGSGEFDPDTGEELPKSLFKDEETGSQD